MNAIIIYDPEDPIKAAARRYEIRQSFEEMINQIDLKELLMDYVKELEIRDTFVTPDSITAKKIITK